MVLVLTVSGKFSSSQRKCDVAPESITNFRVACFTFSDLCLPPGLFLDVFFFIVVSILFISCGCASSTSSLSSSLSSGGPIVFDFQVSLILYFTDHSSWLPKLCFY